MSERTAGARDLARLIIRECREMGHDARAVEVREMGQTDDGGPIYLAVVGDGVLTPRHEYLVIGSAPDD